MAELPPVLGHFTRNRVIVLVTGRTAVARIGGVTAVRRHVATAARLGLEPIVLYPARMKALGAEIAGEVDGRARCLPSDVFTDQAGRDDELALVIAGDWYVSPAAIVDFSNGTRGPAVARFVDRGRNVAPLARMRVGAVRALIPKLADHPFTELISAAVDPDATVVSLNVTERHRLSDNVAIERCEAKLFGWVASAEEPRHVRLVHAHVAVPVTRLLASTQVTPKQVSAVKIVIGLAAAWVLTAQGYAAGVLGALLYWFSRVLDTVAGDLSRAAVVEGSRGEKADVAGDLAVMLTVLGSLAARSASPQAPWLALLASLGIAASATLAYVRVFRWVWLAESAGMEWSERQRAVPRDSFVSRFWRHNGLAYALVLAAILGELDLFLWAAAVGGHLFYILWLRSEKRTAH